MIVNTYLSFNGQCKQAFEFYQKVLGGQIVMMMTHRDTPAAEHMPAEHLDRIMHARLVIGDSAIMGADAPPQFFSQPQGFSVSIMVDDPQEGKRIFDGLAENGNVRMPFQKTFWAAGFGMLVDQFGTPWMINCEGAAEG